MGGGQVSYIARVGSWICCRGHVKVQVAVSSGIVDVGFDAKMRKKLKTLFQSAFDLPCSALTHTWYLHGLNLGWWYAHCVSKWRLWSRVSSCWQRNGCQYWSQNYNASPCHHPLAGCSCPHRLERPLVLQIKVSSFLKHRIPRLLKTSCEYILTKYSPITCKWVMSKVGGWVEIWHK